MTARLSPAEESRPAHLPLWLKVSFTTFMAVLVPVYWINYGPTNFFYFCDAALFIAWAALWTESALLASMAAVGIVLPQLFWCIDFGLGLCGVSLSGMTAYMFDAQKPLFLRGLSSFHGWLPFLLLGLVGRLGYDRRALPAWTVLAWILCLVAYFFLPAAGAPLVHPNQPINVNYVFGFDDAKAQSWMSPAAYLVAWMLALFVVLYVPTHFFLKRWAGFAPAGSVS